MKLDFHPDDLIVSKNYGRNGQPHDAWTQLRREAPIWRCETESWEPFWAVTRHADIMDISSRPDVFSNSIGPILLDKEAAANRQSEGSPFDDMKTIIQMDPPEHVDFRKVASGFFTPRSIHRLDEIVTECARERVDALGESGECDFVEEIAQRHPLRVLASILGIEREDEERVLELTQQLFAPDDPDLQRDPGGDRREAARALGLEFYQLFERIIQDRRASPRDDLASMLANAKLADGRAMGPMETFGYYFIVFTAGHDTTRNAIAGGMRALVEQPEQLELLRKNPELIRSAIEEIVRWTSPVNYMRRRILKDVTVHGVKLREGEDLAMFYCSANRDEDVFEQPFDFDITRHPNRHLGFGTGQHFCLGAHVARLSSRALFQELATRIEKVELAAEPSHIAASFVVGLKTLPIRYEIRPTA